MSREKGKGMRERDCQGALRSQMLRRELNAASVCTEAIPVLGFKSDNQNMAMLVFRSTGDCGSVRVFLGNRPFSCRRKSALMTA